MSVLQAEVSTRPLQLLRQDVIDWGGAAALRRER